MLRPRISQGISSGCHDATPAHKRFRNCHYCGKGLLSFCCDLAKVIFQGATMPPLHHFLFLGIIIFVGRGIMLLLRLSQVIYSRCHHATPTTTNNFHLALLREGGIMLLLRLSQGISSGCHHATPTTTKNFSICLNVFTTTASREKNKQQLVVPGNKTMKQVCVCCDMSQMQPLLRAIFTACPENVCVCVRARGF